MYHVELKPTHLNQLWKTHDQWEKEIEKFFDVFSRGDYFAPTCEIRDGEKFYSISLDIPGLKKDEIDLEFKDNRLYVTGERKKELREEKETMVRTERRYGKFSRVFSLPQDVKEDLIEAQYNNGVLEIRLPKEEKSQPKKITISDWSEQDAGTELKS